MNHRAFTLVEVLAATALSALIAITAGSWLLSVQRSATAVRQQAGQSTAAMLVITRLREDLQHATAGLGAETSAPEFLIAGAGGGPQQLVRWRVAEATAERATRPAAGGTWASETIASRVEAIRCQRDERGRLHVRVTAGSTALALPVEAMGSDGP